MQQFMQSTENLQQQFADLLHQGADRLCMIPAGLAWFEAAPLSDLLSSPTMAVAIYPSESLLKAHLFRMKLLGLREGHDVFAITSDLPPHMERHIWTMAEQQRIPLLLIPAKKMQSITTLSQLVRTPKIGPLILEEAQWTLSGLWGPQKISVYENLAILSKHQWEHRPQLLAFSRPLSKRHQAALAAQLDISAWPPVDMTPLLQKQVVEVSPAWSRHQKLKQLLNRLNDSSAPSQITMIVAHSHRALQQLETRLPVRNLLILHHQMPPEEKELCLMQLLHANRAVVLVESRMLSEIPTAILPVQNLRLIYWQLPWTLESLVRDICRLAHPETQSMETLLLACRDDFQGQMNWLKSLTTASKTQARLMRDHLSRVRHFYRSRERCRTLQLERLMGSERLSPVPCGTCDNCTTGHASPISSFWRNLVSRIRL